MPRTMKRLLSLFLLLSFATSSAATVSVSTTRLDDVLVNREARAAASVVSANAPVVTSQVSALVSEVLHDVGASVKKGDLIVRLDDDNARLALGQARAALQALEAQLVEAQARAANGEELLKRNFISDEELIARQAALAVVEANRDGQRVAVEAAELDLARTRIVAPFDAVILVRHAQVGGYVQPGSPIVTLTQSTNREIEAEVDAKYLETIGGVDSFVFESRSRRWPARLLRLSTVLDPSSGTLTARFAFVDKAAPIGSSGQVVWNELEGVVPVDLIVQRDSRLGVFVIDGTVARFVPVDGAQQGRPAAINLPAGTMIVTRGQRRLQDGDTVEVVGE